jgi:hypothetical protein
MVELEFQLNVLIFHQHFDTNTAFSKHENICVSTRLIQGKDFHFSDTITIILTLMIVYPECPGPDQLRIIDFPDFLYPHSEIAQ